MSYDNITAGAFRKTSLGIRSFSQHLLKLSSPTAKQISSMEITSIAFLGIFKVFLISRVIYTFQDFWKFRFPDFSFRIDTTLAVNGLRQTTLRNGKFLSLRPEWSSIFACSLVAKLSALILSSLALQFFGLYLKRAFVCRLEIIIATTCENQTHFWKLLTLILMCTTASYV